MAKELVKLGYSRQHNRKADEGSHHPDRNAQFEHINAKVIAAQVAGLPVISVDTKKKELVGNFKNGGSDDRPKGEPLRVNVHDFEDKTLGKVVPYGIYDAAANAGFVSLGITSDTAEFAVAAIRCWLERMGRERYPQAKELTITADCGGSNGARVRLWKLELQRLADATGLTLHVHHYPPGTELALRKLVKRKAARKTIEASAEREDRGNVIDLMEALRNSVKGRKAAALQSRSDSRKSAPARKRRKRGRGRKAA